MLFVAAMLLGIIPQTDLVEDSVDVIELNKFYDGQGRHVFDQLIFYDWDEHSGQHQVRAWRMYKTSAQIPHYNERTGEYVLTWHDVQNGNCMRQVTTKSFRKTFTQYDPELIARKKLSIENRKELSKPRKH